MGILAKLRRLSPQWPIPGARRRLSGANAYAGLFIADWYVSRYPDVARSGLSPLRHYLRHGSRQGRRPNPWFQPEWYRARYRDVDAAGVEPLLHYAQHGWRERRDPSSAFSTSYYLEENPDVAEAGSQPLAHFIHHGRAEGRRPHRHLSGIDLAHPEVAIIVDARGCGEEHPNALRALLRQPPRAAHRFYVLRNADDKAGDGKLADEIVVDEIGIAALNIAARSALESRASHLWFLSKDAQPAPSSLDLLIDTCEPVVGPVTDRGAPGQTVPLPTDMAWSAEKHVQLRNAGWRNRTFLSEHLSVSCLLLRREVMGRAGYFDPEYSSVESSEADFSLRVNAAGFESSVARAVLVPVTTAAEPPARLPDRLRDLERFDWRHGRSPVSREEGLLQSWQQDEAERVITADTAVSAYQSATMAAHSAVGLKVARDALRDVSGATRLRRTLKRRDLEIQDLRQQLAREDAAGPAAPKGRRETLRFGSSSNPVRDPEPKTRAIYAGLLRTYWAALQELGCANLKELASAGSILHQIARAMEPSGAILVFANLDPITCDEKDGYNQRVIAMDRLFEPCARIYVRLLTDVKDRPSLTAIADRVWTLWVADADLAGRALIEAVADFSKIYVHSVLSLEWEGFRRAAMRHASHATIDIHGAVPEETNLVGDPYRGQGFDALERTAWRKFEGVVCVGVPMAEHLGQKHNSRDTAPVVLPIMPQHLAARAYRRARPKERPRTCYAGGTQAWQQVGKIVEAVIATHRFCDHSIFTPQIEELERAFDERDFNYRKAGIVLQALEHDEVLSRLEACDFGLLLRDISIINRVSCPTKLIEYLALGVIPVLDSPHVGDFVERGMAYVPLESFLLGRWPDATARMDMAARNRKLFIEVSAQVADAETALGEWRDGAQARAARFVQ